MIKKLLAVLAAVTLATIGLSAPAFAGRSACPQTYVCAWNNASWTGTMAMWQPSPARCVNFDGGSSQDAISSLASYNGGPGLVSTFFKDINCDYNGGNYVLLGTSQVKDLKGTGYNDTFSSVSFDY